MKYDEQQVLKHMKKCYKQRGLITVKDYDEYRKTVYEAPSVQHISNIFGWNNMVRKMKLRPNGRLNTMEILGKMKEKILELGYIPTSLEWKDNKYQPTLMSLKKTHGFTYKEAISILGFYYPHTRGTQGKVENKICSCCHTVITDKNKL